MKYIVWADGRESEARKINAENVIAALVDACSMFGVEPAEVNIIHAESFNGGPNIGEAEYYGVSHAL